jgi:hypothetical protein
MPTAQSEVSARVIERGADGYYHPSTVGQVRALVLYARDCGATLRVRGSGHSVEASIRADGHPIDVLLDRMRAVTITPEIDGEHAVVQVEGGCNLGLDPYDPSGTSNWNNSLSVQLHRAGWALNALGGISHQTVSGFLMTGSAGGSTKYSFGNSILRLQLVDGTGRIHEVGRDDAGENRRLFEAAGVSLGLLGVITKVWLRAIRAYNIVGREVTTPIAVCPIDLFGEGTASRPSLAEFLDETPYSRVLWWPQPQFDRVQIWSATPEDIRADFRPKPFEILNQLQTVSGAFLQTVVGNLRDLSQVPAQLESLGWLYQLERGLAGDAPMEELRATPASSSTRERRALRRGCARGFTRIVGRALKLAFQSAMARRLGVRLERGMPQRIHSLMTLFVEDGTKEFRDHWHDALPMDNQMDMRLWPTSFAELWVPLQTAPAVMQRLREMHQQKDAASRYSFTKAFPLEIYAGPRSSFWLSPGYERECLRINPVWMDQWPGDPVRDLYQSYYDALKEFDFRPHWGKYLPHPGEEWRAYYRRQLPKLDKFLALRREMDPGRIFANEYWRSHLGI